MQLSIIIVNYNVKYFLEHCLLSVIKACADINAEIFVVDNNSTDGSRQYLKPKFPEVKFKWNAENAGFGKANNSVLKETTGKYILFLNPDTIVPEDCFTKCISFFETHTDCGALGVRMIDGSGKYLPESKRSLPSASGTFFKMIGLANKFPASKYFAKYYAGHLPEKENNKTEVLAGACMMLSRKAVEITNGFDEDFFMYGEDVDLSYRILKAGMSNYYFADTTIIHFKGESTQRNSPHFQKHFYGAMKIFAEKHYGTNKIVSAIANASISFGKMITGIFKKPKAAHAKFTQLLNTIISAPENEAIKIRQALEEDNFKIKKIVHPNADLKNEMKNIGAIVFCEGEETNKEIIAKMEILPKDMLFLIHETGAKSMIGSNDKNTRGVFIPMN